MGAPLTRAHLDALREVVEQWIHEGFTVPPYTEAQYDIFEWLGVQSWMYDIRRPGAAVASSVAESPERKEP